MKKILIASIVVVALSGCGSTSKGIQEFNTANQLAAANEYKEAIAYLEQAIQKNPDNQDFTAKLAQLRSEYLLAVTSEVQMILQGQMTKAKLDLATIKLQDLISSGVNNSQVEELLAKVEESRGELYSELAEMYAEAKILMDQEKYAQSFAAFKQISSKFENYEDVQSRMQSITTSANKAYLTAARAAIKQDRFVDAKVYLNDLLSIVPNNMLAKKMLEDVAKKDNEGYFVAKAKAAFELGDWKNVLENCRRATQYRPTAECTEMLATAKEKQSNQLSMSILEAMSEGRLLEAVNYFIQYEQLGVASIAQVDKLRMAISQQNAYSADLYKQNGNYAMSWYLLKSISDIHPTYLNLFTEIREVEDAIFNRSRRSIAVFDFNSPSNSEDAGVIVANNLISRLFNNASNDITILERENLKSILEEMKLGQIGVVSESTAKEMGRVYGIDYAIMGSVLLYKVEENTSTSTKTIRYEVGKKIEDNIEYLNWSAANPDPSKKELADAPKAKILVPEYDEKEYEVMQTKKVGFLQLSFRIVDVQTGENTRVDTIERKTQVSDSSNAGVSDAGIQFDAMEVPTDTEILQQLTEDVIENMAQEVLRPLQQLETYYFNQGTDREKRSELVAAVEYYTYAAFNEKLKSISSSPVTLEAQKRIDEILARYRFLMN